MKYKGFILMLFLLVTLVKGQLAWTVMFQMTPDTLTDGMTWDGEYLWITAEGPPPRIFKLDSLGVKIETLPAPGSQPTGLTWDGNHFWVGSHTTGIIYKIDPINGSVITSFDAPGSGSNEGLAFDGVYLWNTNWNNDRIWKLDTLGTQLGQFNAPGPGSTGLTWDGTHLWNSDQNRDSVYRIDPANGQVVRREPGPPDPVIQDLAFDGIQLWTCGYYTGTVYCSSPIVGIKDNRTKTKISASFQVKLYPNPCFRNVILAYRLQENSNVSITIYDATGTLISTLFDGQREAGVYESPWYRPSSIPAGIYFLRFKTEDFSETKSLIILN